MESNSANSPGLTRHARNYKSTGGASSTQNCTIWSMALLPGRKRVRIATFTAVLRCNETLMFLAQGPCSSQVCFSSLVIWMFQHRKDLACMSVSPFVACTSILPTTTWNTIIGGRRCNAYTPLIPNPNYAPHFVIYVCMSVCGGLFMMSPPIIISLGVWLIYLSTMQR